MDKLNEKIFKISKATRSDYEEYLVYLYFGAGPDYLQKTVDRAYRDCNRTLHEMSSLPSKDALREEAQKELRQILDDLRQNRVVNCQSEFDGWHRTACQRIIAFYDRYGYHRMHVGQAQKWINMTFKYIFVLGENRVPGFGDWYQYCHVPFDNILLKRLADRYGFPKFGCSWSRIDDYDEYLSRQEWIRKRFSSVPLDVEFQLWLKKSL